MSLQISVTDSVQLSYYDSGAPADPKYTTLFAFHGLGSSAYIYSKVLSLARRSTNLRLVSINRRGYGTSTTYSPDEVEIISNGSEEKRAELFKIIGQQLATFIAKFIETEDLPPISDNGRSGGVAITGWSFGNTWAISTLAAIESCDDQIRTTFKSHLRAYIMQDPAGLNLGYLPYPKMWTPLGDTTIPEDSRFPLFSQWVSSYFSHNSVTSKDADDLEWIVPSTSRIPTIFNMTPSDLKQLDSDGIEVDTGICFNFIPQILGPYRTTLFSKDYREDNFHSQFKLYFFAGKESGAFAIEAAWLVEEDDIANGGGWVENWRIVDGANHYVHWDEPQKTLDLYSDLLGL